MSVLMLVPARCAATSCEQRAPASGLKKLITPALISLLLPDTHHQRRFRLIGPPYSNAMSVIRMIGAPERNPLVPWPKSSRETLLFCIASFSNVPRTEPLNTLLPLFVTRLMNRPDDC